jgi:hypothetical protein
MEEEEEEEEKYFNGLFFRMDDEINTAGETSYNYKANS